MEKNIYHSEKTTVQYQNRVEPKMEQNNKKPQQDKNFIQYCKERDGVMIVGVKVPFEDVLRLVFQVILSLFAIFASIAIVVGIVIFLFAVTFHA